MYIAHYKALIKDILNFIRDLKITVLLDGLGAPAFGLGTLKNW